jgi:hypothetical protein
MIPVPRRGQRRDSRGPLRPLPPRRPQRVRARRRRWVCGRRRGGDPSHHLIVRPGDPIQPSHRDIGLTGRWRAYTRRLGIMPKTSGVGRGRAAEPDERRRGTGPEEVDQLIRGLPSRRRGWPPVAGHVRRSGPVAARGTSAGLKPWQIGQPSGGLGASAVVAGDRAGRAAAAERRRRGSRSGRAARGPRRCCLRARAAR